MIPGWPSRLAWGLYGIVVVYTLLLFTVTDPTARSTLPIRLLYPVAMLGAVVIMLAAGVQQRGKRRWAWVAQAAGMLIGGVIAEVIQLAAYVRGEWAITPLTDVLYLVAYGPAMIGCALYLERRPGWAGNATRIVLDSATIGCTVLVLLQSLLPLLLQTWPWTDEAIAELNLLGLDIALLFIVSIMAMRYRRGGGPLLVLSGLCFLCILIADTISVYLSWIPGGDRWHLAEDPLYLLHSVCLALGAYWSVQHPPRLPEITLEEMPVGEWLLWTKMPRLLLLATIGVMISGAKMVSGTVWLLLAISAAREVQAALDHRRVLRDLHTAERLARQAKELADQAGLQTQDFLDRIVHDLGSPAHGLQTGFRHMQGDTHIATITKLHLQQLTHLVDQLRVYQRARHLHGTLPVLGSIDLAPMCFAAINAIQDRADAGGVQVRLDLEDAVTQVVADATALRRVLDNLLANALVATEAGGSIVLQVRQATTTTMRIEVRDTGCGIPPDQQARIFSPMVRLRGDGTGLGLAITKELVQAMRGEIGVLSEVGAGSSFWFELPVPSAAPAEREALRELEHVALGQS
jgi:signal transduction histidine kinase